MLIKLAVGVLAVLLLRMLWPSLVRGTRRMLLAFAIAAAVFGAVVWITAETGAPISSGEPAGRDGAKD